jgi:glycosyltransferase involved in cell wall biosynthesis
MPDERPLVSVLTPSYNQAPFLRAALDSVLQQEHEPLEHIVVDGGSTDGSVEVLEEYGRLHAGRLRWTSEPDRGQSHAVNKALAAARGTIVGWLNSDDAYLPGAISRVVQAFRENRRAGLVYGTGSVMDREGRRVRAFAHAEPFNLWRLVYVWDYVLQPAAFFRRELLERVGWLREDLHYAMDWDLWIRLAQRAPVIYLPEPLASSREYGEAKTFRGGWPRFRELVRLMRLHGGRRYPPAYFLYGSDTLDRTWIERLPGPLRRRARKLLRRRLERLFHGLPVHADGWLAPSGRALVPAHWSWARLFVDVPPVSSLVPLRLTVRESGRTLLETRLEAPGTHPLKVSLPARQASPPGFLELAIVSDRSFRPSADGISADRRRLAVRLLSVEGARGDVGAHGVVNAPPATATGSAT